MGVHLSKPTESIAQRVEPNVVQSSVNKNLRVLAILPLSIFEQ